MRLGLVPSALVIGSMAPDLPYYLPLSIESPTTHSTTGVFGIDLLLGLVSFGLWHALVAPLAVAVAPSGLRARLVPVLPFRPGDLRRWLMIVVSLLAGAATHVLWDEFTHEHRWGYRHLAWLAQEHGPLAGYRWAQYGSGLVGAALIALAGWSWWRSASVTAPVPPSALPARTVRVVLVSVGLAVFGGAAAAFGWTMLQGRGIRPTLFLIATWGGGVGLVIVLLAAVLLHRSGRTGREDSALETVANRPD